MKIALYGRTFPLDDAHKMGEMLTFLQSRKVQISIYQPFYHFLRENHAIHTVDVSTFTQLPPDDTDCLISTGGDGTFLGSLPHVRNSGIPVVGINYGRLGFLSAASFEALPETIDAILTKNYTIEERTLLQVESPVLPDTMYPCALNEIAVQRHSPAMIGVHVRLNDEPLPVYRADGLLVATPTGSTAYSLSVGGPIVVPESQSLILSPVAPHNLNIRAVVIPDSAILSMTVETREGNAFLTVDNQLTEIPSGTGLVIKKAPFPLRIIRLNNSNFFATISEKLSWGKDKRNIH